MYNNSQGCYKAAKVWDAEYWWAERDNMLGKDSESERLLKKEVLEVNQIAWLRLRKKAEGLKETELQDRRGMVPYATWTV